MAQTMPPTVMLTLDVCNYDKASDKSRSRGQSLRMKASIPLLRKLGMFNLFTEEEWVQGKRPGRKLMGEEA